MLNKIKHMPILGWLYILFHCAIIYIIIRILSHFIDGTDLTIAKIIGVIIILLHSLFAISCFEEMLKNNGTIHIGGINNADNNSNNKPIEHKKDVK